MPARFDPATVQRLARLSFPASFAPAVQPSPVRVLVAGDHPTLLTGLKTMLELDPTIRVVGQATDECDMIKLAHRLKPDVVLVDLDMRCCDNFEAIAEISEQRLARSIVGLTIYDCDVERSAAQAAGVNLFLQKGVPYKQLISAVRLASVNSPGR